MDAVSAAPARRSRRQRWAGRMGPAGPPVGRRTEKSGGVPLRIAMLAPPWISVPAPGYGGVESVVSTLTEALVRRGHAVTLFCAPGSVSRANVVTLLGEPHPTRSSARCMRSTTWAERSTRSTSPPSLIASMSSTTTAASRGSRWQIASTHRSCTPCTGRSHRTPRRSTRVTATRGRSSASAAQLASAPPGLGPIGSIPNPIDLRAWPMQERKGDYLLWVGRITPEKGPHRAIAAARAVDVPLVLAGVIQPGQQAFFDREIAPHIDGKRVRFVGEVGGSAKRSLFAHARGLLMPIRWDEPFGMVMVEALACGTPVIAFPEGAVRELVIDGKTGFLVDDERAMAVAVGRLPRIAARDCRAWVSRHCDVEVVAAAYERTYRSVALHSTAGALASV